MVKKSVRILGVLTVLTVLTALFSCSSANKGPEKGTPAFYWQAARETWTAGDYVKTTEHLDKLLETDNEYSARALPWSLTLLSGYIAGYGDLASSNERGARANRQDPSSFRRQVSQYRTLAGRTALHFVETWDKRAGKLTDATVPLAFTYPRGNSAQGLALGKIGTGIVLPAVEIEKAQAQAIERGVLLAACNLAGAPNDTAKAEQVLHDGNAQLAKPVFLLRVAEMLYEQSQLYTGDKLDDPQKVGIFCQRAQDALKDVPASKESKEIAGKIQAAMKKVKGT